MTKDKPLVNSDYLLQKFPGKGGWTYAEIPEILQNKNNPFGWVKVKGTIDSHTLKQYKLMPMGNGKLFLPVKAEIIACFKNESKSLFQTFTSFTEGEQKTYLDWIYLAKTEETKANRIAAMMGKLQKKLRFNDPETINIF